MDGRTVLVSCLAARVVSSVRSIGCSPVRESLFSDAHTVVPECPVLPEGWREWKLVGGAVCVFLLRLSGSV